MDLSPADISGASFRTIRKGYDPAEVDAFLSDAARSLEAARQHATAMEARARAAVARLQDANAESPATPVPAVVEPPKPEPPAPPVAPVESDVHLPVVEAETISRTLLLAQHTADTTVADAEADAERIRSEARAEAAETIDSTRQMSAKIVEDAKAEARKASDHERLAAENEVEALVARREFLIGDVDQLERFLIDQRDRLRGAARQIDALCERVPSGLGSVRPPVLSASDDDEPGDPTAEIARPIEMSDDDSGDDTGELDETAPIEGDVGNPPSD